RATAATAGSNSSATAAIQPRRGRGRGERGAGGAARRANRRSLRSPTTGSRRPSDRASFTVEVRSGATRHSLPVATERVRDRARTLHGPGRLPSIRKRVLLPFAGMVVVRDQAADLLS